MVTREDVVMAYRLLHHREPETNAIIEQWIRDVRTTDDMIAGIVQSEEFQRRMGTRIALKNFRLSETSPPIDVDVSVNESELAALFSRIKHQWETIGESEVHWSVLTDDRYRPEEIRESLDAFYATGAKELDTLRAYLARNGITESDITTCFELGCGVGRITEHLASAFPRVIGADISSKHLQQAAVRLGGLGTVEFRLLKELADLKRISGYDLFYSVIVFQHNPPPVIAWMLRVILENLNPHGVAFFQVPSYYENYAFSADHYLKNDPMQEQAAALRDGVVPDELYTMDAHPLPQRHVFAICREMNCDVLEVREDDWVGNPRRSLSNTWIVRKRAG